MVTTIQRFDALVHLAMYALSISSLQYFILIWGSLQALGKTFSNIEKRAARKHRFTVSIYIHKLIYSFVETVGQVYSLVTVAIFSIFC
jgi:hypothetical protein